MAGVKKVSRDGEWSTLSDSIEHEFFLASNLNPNSPYQFRVKANNFIGWGEFSASTATTRTTPPGENKIELNRGMQYLQQQTESGKKAPQQWQEKRDLDYSKEHEPVKLKTGENAELQVRKYNPVAEWGRGKYSLVVKCVRSDDRRHFALKLLDMRERSTQVKEEVEALKSLRHERIAQLYESYCVGNVTVLVMEPLAGVDVLTYMASQYQYSEQQIYTVVNQVLDALSYLHWRGYSHLDLQPDNIVLTSTRRCDVKLVDFGSAQQVSKAGSPINLVGHVEYMAPEVMLEQRGFVSSDIWSLGVVTYVLLAGASPFAGLDEEETRSNVQYVRFKFEHLSAATTQEAIRFIMLIFKRDPSKRPTVDECRDHKWMLETDFTTKKRERAVFFGTKLREYDLSYHRARTEGATRAADLLNFNDAAFLPRIAYDPDVLADL
ncbi:hypothetical protein Pcinc_028227 [Petrolisthes cinctipes]|uniref:Uncharacterized protein n=1 Tax=Petrolisthes cinctipes TaxID=88211 RepID=A0AAE1K5N0_PETCI|nr:hypothetical protein Pcinc_028227 [Petrolisthes cinctipes]